jgi:hypothetical protein
MATKTATIGVPVHRHLDHRGAQREVGAYMPGNYAVEGDTRTVGEYYVVTVKGEDRFGWTLEDYVLPRLASGGLYPITGV